MSTIPFPLAIKCDQCGRSLKRSELHYAMVPRPSDSTTLVCIMWGCGVCFKDEYTAKELEEYFDRGDNPQSQASLDGYLFYII